MFHDTDFWTYYEQLILVDQGVDGALAAVLSQDPQDYQRRW